MAAGGALLHLPRRIPYHVAMEMALTGDPITAERGHELGLVNRLAKPDRPSRDALTLAAEITANGPLALIGSKRIIQESRDWPLDEMWERQGQIAEPIMSSEDAQEGSKAFAEKRDPQWRGSRVDRMDESLRGQLLIAAPQLSDYFRRTVVLVLEHTEEGAMGLVLNRPTESEVIEAVPSLSSLVDGSDLVHAGGPVQPDSVLVLGDFEEPEDAGTQVVGTLGLLDPERPEAELHRARVFAGYAGWAPGQLDWSWTRRRGSWLPPTPATRSARTTSGATRCAARAASTHCWPDARRSLVELDHVPWPEP